MARPQGVRNRDFENKRLHLVRTLTDYALNADLNRPSLRQFAQAAGASEPTLRHYFSDRVGVVRAILQEIGARGERIWSLARIPAGAVDDAIKEYLTLSEGGVRHRGFVRAHAFGLIEGLADPDAGHAYATFVLQPALNAVAEKLKSTPGGPRDDAKLQTLALMLFAPLLIAVLKDEFLAPDASTPLDLTKLIDILGDLTTRSLGADGSSQDAQT